MECAEQRRSQEAPPRPPPPRTSRDQRETVSEEATPAFKTFQKLHDKIHSTVQKALTADEEGDNEAAGRYYNSSLMLVEEALGTDCETMPGATATEKDSAKLMLQKINKTKLQIKYRLESLQSDDRPLALSDCDNALSTEHSGIRLPSYEEAVSSSDSSLIADAALGDSIMSAEYPNMAASQQASREGTEIFTISEGVQIFHITPEGFVSAPSYPTSLHIVKLEDVAEGNMESLAAGQAPPAFIQVGDWFYPLIPEASSVLHTTYGAYVFPDLAPERTGSSVALMLPEAVGVEEKQLLEDILQYYSAVQQQQAQIQPEDLVIPSAPPEELTTPETEAVGERHEQVTKGTTTSEKISNGILVASKWISWGVGKGAEKAGELISYGSARLRSKLRPEEQPKPVDPRVQKSMVYARKATHVAVSVSSYAVTKLGEATMALGRQIAPHIRKKGEKLLPGSMKSDGKQSKLDGVIEVAASGLHGFGTVYMSLEGAAKALARSLANETVSTVQHKYGNEAGKLTENAVYAVGNVAMTANNANNFGIKAVAKRAAKDTGKAVLKDLHEKQGTSKQMDGASVDSRSGNKSTENRKPPM